MREGGRAERGPVAGARADAAVQEGVSLAGGRATPSRRGSPPYRNRRTPVPGGRAVDHHNPRGRREGREERISDGQVRLRAGTLYAAFDRLQEEGLITEDREEIVDGRVRRYYRLTGDGAARLAAEAERMRRHAKAATVRLRAIGSGGTA
ncbi:PadR family transcriptional regulator [Nonomuraea sp. NPDC049646]|uniref:PadR family transcriptional regulator n=1 Tax=unclassified Nonomuraea TaxID=2593643 RepID=UPI00379205C7